MMIYSELAEVYDYLMEDIDYEEWADYLAELLAYHKVSGRRVLDLGCGTGSISLLLAQRGFDLVCVDFSLDMLAIAEQKFREHGFKIPIYRQDIRELYLEKPVDVVISTFDTLNYILQVEDLIKTFQQVHKVLKNEGIFIFDLNTEYKLARILGNNTYTYNTEDIVYIWDNEYDPKSKLCHMYLTFFKLEEKTGKYFRFDEIHTQRLYTEKEITELLRRCGFSLLGVFDQLKFIPPEPESEKVFFVARKI